MSQSMTHLPLDTPSPALMRFAVIGSAALVVVAGAAFYMASQLQGPVAGPVETQVTITSSACEPDSLTIPAGPARFAIHNASDRVLEWEILDGVMVLAERENITPGMTAVVSPRLVAGNYAITCGLLSNPHGTLVVAPSGAENHAPPDITAYVGPLAEMKVDLTLGGRSLVKSATTLAAAIKAGDLAAAQAAYPAASAAYARIEPTARRFADLSTAIDASATYYQGKENDPAFTGLHRIEYGLFGSKSLDGLAPVADKLAADSQALANRLATIKPAPEMLAGNAADLLVALSQTAIPAGAQPYAGNDLADLSAVLDATDKLVTLLKPVATRPAPDQMAKIESEAQAARAAVDAHKGADGFAGYQTVDAAARQQLAADFAALGQSLAGLNAKLGLQ